jgi:hypothetical protein
MRQFGFLIGHFTYIVQQTGPTGFLGIQTEFRSHNGTKVRRFTRVLQQVLTVGRTVFHFTHQTNQFGMQTVHA